MKFRRASIFTKIVVLVLAVYAIVTLVSLRGRIDRAEEQTAALAAQVEDKRQSNSSLAYDIEHSGDPDVIADIARNKLGLVMPGEQVFYDVNSRQG